MLHLTIFKIGLVVVSIKKYQRNGRRFDNSDNVSSQRTRENGQTTRLHSRNVGQESRIGQRQNSNTSTGNKSGIDNGIRAEKVSNEANKKSSSKKKSNNLQRYEQNAPFMEYLNENEYLKELMKLDEKKGETFAHSTNRLIEQEIRKLENTNGFDNNIPVTKLTNIDESIENYLGKTIGKGHFRERARGIYNKNTDRISVKEYKDLDNVLHELGHALDLGGRINVDKASLSDELLAATKKSRWNIRKSRHETLLWRIRRH